MQKIPDPISMRGRGVSGLTEVALVVGASSVLLVGWGCSTTTEELPRPGTCDPFQIVSSSPAEGAAEVSTDAVGTFRFNDFPDPATIGPSNFSLWAGVYYHTGQFAISLVDMSASFRPANPLVPDRAYTLLLEPTVRSLRGCGLEPQGPTPEGRPDPAYAVSFRTAAADAGPSPPHPVSAAATFTDVAAVFARRCSGAGCHLEVSAGDASSEPGDDCSAIPAGRLSLCARDARAQLVGIGADEVPRLVRVAPHDSARSYLLRKLVGAPPVMGHEGTPVAAEEGISMEDLHRIESWINAGARP